MKVESQYILLLIILVQLRVQPSERSSNPCSSINYLLPHSFWDNLGTGTIFSSNDQRLCVDGVNCSIAVVTDPNHLVHTDFIPWFDRYASLVTLLPREGAGGTITPVKSCGLRVTEVNRDDALQVRSNSRRYGVAAASTG